MVGISKIIKDIDVVFILISVLFFTGCACSGYSGDCFDAKIGQVDVIPLQSKKILSQYKDAYRAASVDIGYTKWQVLEPVAGTIDVQFSLTRPDQKKWIGDDPVLDVIVIPLENQRLETEQKRVKIDNVRIEGRSPITVSSVLKTNTLPSGKYLFKATLRGRNNWDRKTIFVTVK